jgi:hypothetical protein
MTDTFAVPGIRHQHGQEGQDGQDGHVHLSGPDKKLPENPFLGLTNESIPLFLLPQQQSMARVEETGAPCTARSSRRLSLPVRRGPVPCGPGFPKPRHNLRRGAQLLPPFPSPSVGDDAHIVPRLPKTQRRRGDSQSPAATTPQRRRGGVLPPAVSKPYVYTWIKKRQKSLRRYTIF